MLQPHMSEVRPIFGVLESGDSNTLASAA